MRRRRSGRGVSFPRRHQEAGGGGGWVGAAAPSVTTAGYRHRPTAELPAPVLEARLSHPATTPREAKERFVTWLLTYKPGWRCANGRGGRRARGPLKKHRYTQAAAHSTTGSHTLNHSLACTRTDGGAAALPGRPRQNLGDRALSGASASPTHVTSLCCQPTRGGSTSPRLASTRLSRTAPPRSSTLPKVPSHRSISKLSVGCRRKKGTFPWPSCSAASASLHTVILTTCGPRE